ncbi:MAG: site-specific DNA-methyltransferase [Thermodesulfobacteriota bacterium]
MTTRPARGDNGVGRGACRGNAIHIGDNLPLLRSRIPHESVDLIYMDPPFNSGTKYTIRLHEQGPERSVQEAPAFDDRPRWGAESEDAYRRLLDHGPKAVSELLRAVYGFLGRGSMAAYLVLMAETLLELRRTLTSSGSIYLHCDPTASHYLKLIMDATFGPRMFRNEIVWNRSHTRSSISQVYRRAHDTILFYTKTDTYTFRMQFRDLSEASRDLYRMKDHRGYYQPVPLLVSGRRNGRTGRPWRGIDPNSRGKSGMHWITDPANIDEYQRRGLIHWPKKGTGTPRLKYYLADNKGVPVSDFWDDIPLIPSSSSESLGFPTQKPESLLIRILAASTDPGHTVLDPFSGSGTTAAVAEAMGRRWIVMDKSFLALALLKHRLARDSGERARPCEVVGAPTSVEAAGDLAHRDPLQFRFWALSLVNARPATATTDSEKGTIHGHFEPVGAEGKKAGPCAVLVPDPRNGTPSPDELSSALRSRHARSLLVISLDELPESLRKEFHGSAVRFLTVREILQEAPVQKRPDSNATSNR